MAAVATYQIGPPSKPTIRHDNGFLDKYARRPPTLADRAKYAEWAAILEAAEAAQGVPLIPHNDLPDALAAYRHFLYGKGTDRTFSYERYVASDLSGKITVAHAIWLSGSVTVSTAADIKTGIPDAANGRFEVTGLAQQYMNYSTLVRTVRWTGPTSEDAVVSRVAATRDRKPSDNRRVRNRI